MGFIWAFKDLTPEQKHSRRDALDFYAFVAQASVLVPLFHLQLYFFLCWIQARWRRSRELDVPSSPFLKHEHTKRGFSAARVRVAWRRVVWWMGEEVEVLGCGIGRRGEVIGAGVWTAWLVVLCVVQTEHDYLHLTKRFGIIGASQLPLHYLLAIRSPYSPLQVLTRQSWETLNILHQILGRIVTLLFYLHTVFYLNYFLQSHILATRLGSRVVILGLIAILAFSVVGTSALATVRKRNYRLFYTLHVVLATVLLPVLYWHVHHIRVYIWETLAIYVGASILRVFATRTVEASITPIPDTNLIAIKISLPTSKPWAWEPGQHVYVSLPGHTATRTFRSNPFTIASLPSVDHALTLVARVRDGNTAALVRASGAGPVPLTLEGPYGLGTHGLHLLDNSKVLFVAGGVGATFCVPLYRALLRDLSPSPGSARRAGVRFVWAVRGVGECGWAIPGEESEGERKGFMDRCGIYVTRGAGAGAEAGADGGVDGVVQRKMRDGDDEDEGVEMARLLSSGGDAGNADREKDVGGLDVRYGRPDIRREVEETFAGTGMADRVAVLVCGPSGLARDVRREVGRYVRRGVDVWLHCEEFAL